MDKQKNIYNIITKTINDHTDEKNIEGILSFYYNMLRGNFCTKAKYLF